MWNVFMRICVRHLLLVVFLFSCSGTLSYVIAQSPQPTLAGGKTTVDSKEKASKAPIQEVDFDALLKRFQPNFPARLGRGFEYDFQRVEQPQVLSTTSGTIVNNPERYLNEHTLRFQFSEMFPSSSSLAAAYKSFCAFLANEHHVSSQCQDSKSLNRIASGGGWWARALSGVTLTADLSERPALQQGVVVAETSFSNHYQVGGSFDFDPTPFFINGSNWSKAAAVITKVKDHCGGTTSVSTSNQENLDQWLDNLSGPRLLAKKECGLPLSSGPRKANILFATLLPVVSFKRVSQFDFIKSGGILVPTSYLENAQNQFSFKWDLKRAIPSASVRADVADAYTFAHKKTEPARLCMIAFGKVQSFIPVSNSFEASECKKFATISKADSYGLDCIKGKEITPGDPIAIDAEDPVLNEESCWYSAKSGPGSS